MSDSLRTVNDPTTGSNYGGIRADSLGVTASYNEYLSNLLEATRRPVGGPLARQEQYTPSGDRSPVIGQVSSQTLGSVPIFGSGAAIFPQAILDRFAKAKQDAEISYLNEIGNVSLDQFQLSSTLKNPWHNESFNVKYQESLDAWLDASAQNFGGDYMKGMKALQGNKEFLTMRKSYEEYAGIYNSVFDTAVEILATDPKEKYVSDTTYKAAQKFIHDYENLDELPIDELVRRARGFKTHVSVVKIAEMAMDGMGDRVTTRFNEAKGMGTNETDVYVKTVEKGPKPEEIDQIYDAQLEAYPFLKQDPAAAAQLRQQLELRAAKEYEKSLEKINKSDSAEKTYLKVSGIPTDENGRIQMIDSIPTAFRQYNESNFSTGTDGIVYPTRDMDGKAVSVTTMSGTRAYVIDPSTGNLYDVMLPGSYEMRPQREYTLTDAGRFVEGNVTFEDVGLYAREFAKVPTKEGEPQPPVATGGRTAMAEEARPVRVKDLNTGNMVDLRGDYTVVLPFGDIKDELQVAYPFLRTAHADLEFKTGKADVLSSAPAPTEADPKVQVDKPVATREYRNQKRAAKDKGSWVPGDIIVVDGDRYEWTGSKLKKQ